MGEWIYGPPLKFRTVLGARDEKYKYKEEYKQGEMWHSAQRAEISEKIVCSSLAVAKQRVHDSYPRKTTMRNCL
jgi:hypothetical protein